MNQLSRRWVLKGLGATVAIPALPSLLNASDAQAQGMLEQRYFVNLGTHHGAAWERFMVPTAPTAGLTRQMYGGREIRSFPLTRTLAGGNASLSPVLTAPEARFTEALKNKMWVARGLDVPWYFGHHTGGHLGNFAPSMRPAATIIAPRMSPPADGWRAMPSMAEPARRPMPRPAPMMQRPAPMPAERNASAMDVMVCSNFLVRLLGLASRGSQSTVPSVRPPARQHAVGFRDGLRQWCAWSSPSAWWWWPNATPWPMNSAVRSVKMYACRIATNSSST